MKQQKKANVSKITGRNWAIDFIVFSGGILAAITGIYFLFFISGGFQGGRNPTYGITFLFDRELWEFLHRWTGVAMVAAALVHIVLHWKWIIRMTRRFFSNLFSKNKNKFNKNSRMNLWVNAFTGLSFILVGGSGVYLFFVPLNSSFHYVFSREGWDMIHTWSGLAMILSAILHFVIHWRWIKNVSLKLVGIEQQKEETVSKKKWNLLPNALITTILVIGLTVTLFGTVNRTMVITRDIHLYTGSLAESISVQNVSNAFQSNGRLDHESEDYTNLEAEEHIEDEITELVTITGNISLIDSEGWEVLANDSSLIEIHGRTYRFMEEMSFTGNLNDSIRIQGFYENDEFEIVNIDNLENGQTLLVRNAYGSPMWSNNAGK